MVNLDVPTRVTLDARLQVLGRFGSWTWDPATNLMRWSDALYRLHGLEPRAELMTFETHRARLHPDDRERMTAAVQTALAGRLPFCFSHRVERPDGSVGWLECHGEIVEEPGSPLQVLAFCQDVTPYRMLLRELTAANLALEEANEELLAQKDELLVQAEALEAHAQLMAAQEHQLLGQVHRLEQIDRFKDEFLAILSHELRTPLNFILGFSSILEDGLNGPLNDAQQDSVGRIVAGTERMIHLVDDLLEIARIRAGRVPIAPQLEHVASVAGEVAATLDGLAANAGLTLTTAISPELTAWFDASRLAQILTNLIANAIKFTPSGGQILLSAAVVGDMVRLEVADTGPGIPPDALERIFRKFEQVDMSPTRTNSGVGLGLAIAQGLVETQGGLIGVESELGHGCRFWFTLPHCPPDALS